MAHISMPPSSPPNRLWGLLFFATLGLTLALTNPNQEDYTHYAAWKLKETNCDRNLTPPVISNMMCHVLTPLPNDVTAQLISQYTHRDNYVFFSIYHTKFLNAEFKSIGIARVFL